MRRVAFPLLLSLVSLAIIRAQEQQPGTATQSEQEQLEEEFLQSRIENGESHASGARPELGPVVLGNPSSSVVALRVGLYSTTFTSSGGVATEFSSLHHPFVELSNTELRRSVADLGHRSRRHSSYLVAGINSIQYNPVGRTGQATVMVVVY